MLCNPFGGQSQTGLSAAFSFRMPHLHSKYETRKHSSHAGKDVLFESVCSSVLCAVKVCFGSLGRASYARRKVRLGSVGSNSLLAVKSTFRKRWFDALRAAKVCFGSVGSMPYARQKCVLEAFCHLALKIYIFSLEDTSDFRYHRCRIQCPASGAERTV